MRSEPKSVLTLRPYFFILLLSLYLALSIFVFHLDVVYDMVGLDELPVCSINAHHSLLLLTTFVKSCGRG